MELVICFAIAWAIIDSIGQTTSNVAAVLSGKEPPYKGGQRVAGPNTAKAAGAAGRGGGWTLGALGGLIWSSARDGARAGWKTGHEKYDAWTAKRAAKNGRIGSRQTAAAPATREPVADAPELDTKPETDDTPAPMPDVVHDTGRFTVDTEIHPVRPTKRRAASLSDAQRAIATDGEPVQAKRTGDGQYVISDNGKTIFTDLGSGSAVVTGKPTFLGNDPNVSKAVASDHGGMVLPPLLRGDRARRVKKLSDQQERIASRIPTTAVGEHTNPTTQEEDMTVTSGETTSIDALKQFLASTASHVDTEIATQLELAQSHASQAQMDSTTLSDFGTAMDMASNLSTFLKSMHSGIESRHGAVEEAINSTPQVAKTEFYKHQ